VRPIYSLSGVPKENFKIMLDFVIYSLYIKGLDEVRLLKIRVKDVEED